MTSLCNWAFQSEAPLHLSSVASCAIKWLHFPLDTRVDPAAGASGLELLVMHARSCCSAQPEVGIQGNGRHLPRHHRGLLKTRIILKKGGSGHLDHILGENPENQQTVEQMTSVPTGAHLKSTVGQMTSSVPTGATFIGFSGLRYITSSIPPSAEFSPLVQTVNLDFLCHRGVDDLRTQVEAVIIWLKKCSAPPAPVIELWQNYRFIIHCDSIFKHRQIPAPRGFSNAACHAILSQSPELLRVIQAWWVWDATYCHPMGLLHIRRLLDIPWDELEASIGPLRSFPGNNDEGQIQALLEFTIQNPTICPEPYPWPTICRALARGCLRVLCAEPMPRLFTIPIVNWGRLIILSPHCSDLLADIHHFSPFIAQRLASVRRPFNIYDVLQWLKGFPQPPLDVIKQWEEYQDQDQDNYSYRRDVGNVHTFYLGEKYLGDLVECLSCRSRFSTAIARRTTEQQDARYIENPAHWSRSGNIRGETRSARDSLDSRPACRRRGTRTAIAAMCVGKRCVAPTQYAAAVRQPRGPGGSAARFSTAQYILTAISSTEGADEKLWRISRLSQLVQ
ncbi:hypothetical protein DFH09DRAFT_1435590 [Mycena vulgaris]|nr:hypothetical protein DFH09DRAFT_1435590 [Mycena vulgaris]